LIFGEIILGNFAKKNMGGDFLGEELGNFAKKRGEKII
jgi:hypothetical protein